MSTFPLPLPGWDESSVWGWDPGLNCLYAQLYRNGNDPEGSDAGPDVWLMPPEIDTNDVGVLGVAIRRATGAAGPAVVEAMGDRKFHELFVSD